jgi:Tol biopolymer transport system component/DNA-binding winged helix-turn-helix (wHTH) protein
LALYCFDDVQVDTGAFRVERAGEPVALEPKAYDLLVLLLERPGQLVTKQEILDAVWPRTAVTDNALTRIVAHLRKALGDDAREARYIETVPTRGYRWRTPVERREPGPKTPSAASPMVPPASRRWPRRTLALTALAIVAAAAALSLAYRQGLTRGPETPVLLSVWPTQVTVSPRLDVFPALAPDGRAVAYASDRSGGFEIVLKSLVPGATERALTSDGEQNVQPAWSPDGGYLAYHSMRRGGIWILPALGGVPRQVSDFGSDPAWSPDGTRLAFQSDPLADIAPGAFGANVPSTIWSVGRDGSDRRRVTSSADPVGGHAAPAWSPDGRRIVFTVYSAEPQRLWSVPAEGGAATLVDVAHGAMFDPVFTADGRWIYYATGGPFIVRVPIEPETGRRRGPHEAIATPGLAGVRHLSIAGDGQRLAMASLSLSSNLWTVDVASGTGEAAGAPRPLTDDTSRRKTTPAWSPDGRWIAYTGSRGGPGSDIFVMSAADARAVPVTAGELTGPVANPGGPVNYRPTWLPDSARVAFLANDRGRTLLRVADVGSRRTESLLELGPDGPADAVRRTAFNAMLVHPLAPGAREVAFSDVEPTTGMRRLFLRPVAAGERRALSPPDRAETYPIWSKDGRWIASQLRDEKGSHVVLRAVAGGAARILTPEAGEAWVHDWAGDNDRIVFAGLRGGVWNVWWVSRATGKETQVTRYTGVHSFVRFTSSSPRGDRVVFELGEVRGNIWLTSVPAAGGVERWAGGSI